MCISKDFIKEISTITPAGQINWALLNRSYLLFVQQCPDVLTRYSFLNQDPKFTGAPRNKWRQRNGLVPLVLKTVPFIYSPLEQLHLFSPKSSSKLFRLFENRRKVPRQTDLSIPQHSCSSENACKNSYFQVLITRM